MNSAVKRYLSSIGKRGGAAKSNAKTETARRNGKKGGRPRKPTRCAGNACRRMASEEVFYPARVMRRLKGISESWTGKFCGECAENAREEIRFDLDKVYNGES